MANSTESRAKSRAKELTAWQIIQPVRGTINWAMALAMISVIAGLIPVVLIPRVAVALSAQQVEPLGWMVGLAIICTCLSFGTKIWAFRVSHLGAFRLEEILRQRLATHLANLPLGTVMSMGSGAIKKVIQDDVKALHVFVADSTPLMARAYTIPLLTLLILFWTDWRMTLTTITLAPFAMVLMQLAMKDYAERRREYDQANEHINQAVIEFVQGMQVIRTFDDGTSSFVRFRHALDIFTDKLKRWSAATATSGRAGYLLFQSLPTTLVTVVAGSGFLIKGLITFPILLTFLLLAPSVIGGFMPLMMLSHHINAANAAARRIGQILAEPIMPMPDQPQSPKAATIEFDHVSFAYGQRQALENIHLKLPAGSVTALVGPSGAGKSTLAKLIPRFWDVTSGAIKIGGVDVRDMDSDTLMSWVSFVFQDTFLIYDSILENIRLGRPTATMAEVEAAAVAAQAHDFIVSLPEGYQTLAGERGTRLSGGERQRITIARAILQDNPIIVLDEATAFADPENEALIQGAIASLTQDKTLIVVAHRLSTITDADQIVVLDHGSVVESGRHQELVRQQGLYAKLWTYHESAQSWQLQQHKSESISASIPVEHRG
jgi:ATP-binding cassette, subfamily B, bacterial IrtA/YbtP